MPNVRFLKNLAKFDTIYHFYSKIGIRATICYNDFKKFLSRPDTSLLCFNQSCLFFSTLEKNTGKAGENVICPLLQNGSCKLRITNSEQISSFFPFIKAFS